jgi:hypothetical protein
VGGPELRVPNAPIAALLACAAIASAIAPMRAAADEPARRPAVGTRETFSITYVVEISPDQPSVAQVRWELAGIDEVTRVRLRFDPQRFADFEGSGTIDRRRGEIRWSPGGPYAQLRYTSQLNHRHAVGEGYDSYATDDWILTRTRSLFPRSAVLFRPDVEGQPESRARLVFHLPSGWEAVSVMPAAGPGGFVVESDGRFDHPRGWLMLGRFDRTDASIGATAVTITSVSGVARRREPMLALFEQALPAVTTLFGRTFPRLLVVVGPDPMWRGGLSGEESFYIHGDRPLRTPDHTSPHLHELFHVLAPFRPAPDAHWVTEGLAEFYSLELQRRLGRLDRAAYDEGLRLFARYGRWGRDFTRDRDQAVCNNAAPLVMYALDRRVQAVTGGAQSLDAVVGVLAAEGGTVSTARFLGTVRRVAGKSFGAFFRRHVYRGERPVLPELGLAPAPGARRAGSRPSG